MIMLHLICCNTTKGHMNILLHDAWAPIGVQRVLDMISVRYFESKIALFRCRPNDACQFGIPGTNNASSSTLSSFRATIPDDPLWLPTGPDHRQNERGVKRYPIGYFTFAGSGTINTRSNQFVITLGPNQYMGGGSPWEVPLGELVGVHSFETISKFYTGYGHTHGPSQRMLRKLGGDSETIRNQYPLMDYITRLCRRG